MKRSVNGAASNGKDRRSVLTNHTPHRQLNNNTPHRQGMEAPPPQQDDGKEGRQPPHLMVAIEVDRKVRH
jgi:hypothetical protein